MKTSQAASAAAIGGGGSTPWFVARGHDGEHRVGLRGLGLAAQRLPHVLQRLVDDDEHVLARRDRQAAAHDGADGAGETGHVARTLLGRACGARAGRTSVFPRLHGVGPTFDARTSVLRMAEWIVDGNNVMGSRPDGWWRDRRGAQRRLVERLEDVRRRPRRAGDGDLRRPPARRRRRRAGRR